jgi:signal peptidase II
MTPLLTITLAALILSVGSRLLAESLLSEPLPLLGSLLHLSLVENAGVAFGITLPTTAQGLLIAGAFIILLLLSVRLRHEPLARLGFGLILGGALANILDRLDDGLVTDFIAVGSFPTFNVADSCITVGLAVLLVWETWRKTREGKRRKH